ncbi:MAG: hypothetical protein FWE99_05550, partial [Bacteroidales bacterium]|nr:hypothetical protein [Bacteroidales bacterium]
LFPLDRGVWLLTEQQEVIKIADTVFTPQDGIRQLLPECHSVYVAGALTDDFLRMLATLPQNGIRLIVRDFSKLFFSILTYERFVRRGGSIEVLQKPKLLAVCTNPVSPEGIRLDPLVLKEQMQEALQLPVYDIMMIDLNNDI